MHIRVLRPSLAIVLVGGLLPSVCSAGLTVSLVPLREVYHPGEPVAVLLTLKNTGDSEISVPMNRYFDLPLGIGLDFKYPRGVKPTYRQPGFIDLLMYGVPVAPHGESHLVFALNKYMRFEAMGRQAIGYSARYRPLVRKGGGPRQFVHMEPTETKGQLIIEMKPGAIDEKWIRSLIADLNRRDKAPVPRAGEARKGISREDAAELLIWAETPIVIEPLIAAANDWTTMPNLWRDVVGSFQGPLKKYQCARTGIVEIQVVMGFCDFKTAEASLRKEGLTLPGEWLKPIFAYRNMEMTFKALHYLRDRGWHEDAGLVEPLTRDGNWQIAHEAAETLKVLEAAPPRTTPAAPPGSKGVTPGPRPCCVPLPCCP